MYLTETDAVIRLLVAMVFGGLIGLERELAEKAAGLRTNLLVCEGAALFMVSSLLLGNSVAAAGGFGYDPSRIGSTIVQGVGVLAAGVVFASGGRVKGLTTAAGLWVTAAIGLATGVGYFLLAGVATVAALITLNVLNRIDLPARSDPNK